MCPRRGKTSVAVMKKLWVPKSIIVSRWMAWKHLIDSQPPVVWGWTCGRRKGTVYTPLKCHMAGSAVQTEAGHDLFKASCENCPPLCSAAQQSKLNWPQNYSWSPLSSAHLCILYMHITGDPVARRCYVMCTSALCRAQAGLFRSKITCWQM